jgi:signal transduction histidine kinase
MPRLTLRTQFAMLYAGLFFVSGSILVLIPLLRFKSTSSAGGVGHTVARSGTSLGQQLALSAVSLSVLVVLSLTSGWLVADRLLRPLRTITATARDISATNLHRRLGLDDRHNEFSELGETLDDLFQRLEASFESHQHFVANASHELRTPLTAERTLLQVALADPDADAGTLRSACEEALRLGERQAHLVDALLTLATSERGIEHSEPFDLGEVAEKAMLARREEAERLGIRVSATFAPAPVGGDPGLAEILVANLVANALRHNTAGGWMEISTGMAAGRPVVSVCNCGPVIQPDQVSQLFEPFRRFGGQRTSHANGYGLGLAIATAIARAHHAEIAARARPGGGLDIMLVFP